MFIDMYYLTAAIHQRRGDQFGAVAIFWAKLAAEDCESFSSGCPIDDLVNCSNEP
jgi:hypothetical protein